MATETTLSTALTVTFLHGGRMLKWLPVMVEGLHVAVRPGSEKARIWAICDRLYAERGKIPSGRDVVDIYVSESGNEGTGFTQYSHWKKAIMATQAFQEGPAVFEAQPKAVSDEQEYVALNVSADGRLLIPAKMREAMMLDVDGRVTAYLVDGELRVVSPLAAVRQVQKMAQKFKKPGESVVDEFLAERRAMWGEE